LDCALGQNKYPKTTPIPRASQKRTSVTRLSSMKRQPRIEKGRASKPPPVEREGEGKGGKKVGLPLSRRARKLTHVQERKTRKGEKKLRRRVGVRKSVDRRRK